jgi:glycosyltransferase involved in cell wall biosynthesis
MLLLRARRRPEPEALPMRVLLALTYYRPHISGLTIYVERLAHALAARGHDVTVLASQHSRELARSEAVDGIRVVRVPVAFRVSKGVVMPTYGLAATRQVLAHDVLSVHLPQLDAWGIALRGWALGRPTVLTYHCDLRLPQGLVNRVAERVTAGANAIAARFADALVTYTQDYADHVPLLRQHAEKLTVIGPPVVIAAPDADDVAAFLRRHDLSGNRPLIGFAARFASEKGVDVLLAAMPALLARHAGATVVFAGEHENVRGEEEYRTRLRPLIDRLGSRWRFVGTLDPRTEMPAFFGAMDCVVVPSVNSTESFGLVQVEAMLCGTPVVATDLPGVREPVRRTGMGEIVPVADHVALADAVTKVVSARARFARPRSEIARMFDVGATAEAYDALFVRLLAGASAEHVADRSLP